MGNELSAPVQRFSGLAEVHRVQPLLAAALVGVVALLAWAVAGVRTGSVRLGLVLAGVGLGVGVTGATVALSAGHLLQAPELVACWAFAGVVLGVDVVRHRSGLSDLARERWRRRPGPATVDGALLLGVTALVLLILVIAVVAVPNNWDSMTYHLSRVEQWRVRRSVAPYPTTDSRENWSGPFAEYAVLHLRLLSGGDRLAACVQWTALVHAASSASWVASRLGARRRAQIAVVVMAVTAPTVVSEAVTTQNDLVCAAGVLAAVALLLKVTSRTTYALRWGAWAGAAIGLAVLTKSTAVPLLAPFVIGLIWRERAAWPVVWRAGVIAAAVAGGINAPHVADNLRSYGSVTGPTSAVANQRVGIDVVGANAVRYTAMNLATPQWEVNRRLQSTVETGMRAVGLDPNDRADTFGATRFRISTHFNEDVAVDLLHVALFLTLALLAFDKGAARAAFGGFGLSVVAGFLLFCATVAWQPWGMRLLVPSLLLMAIPLGRGLVSPPSRTSVFVLGAALVCAVPWVTRGQLRPLTGPQSILTASVSEQRFAAKPAMRAQYDGAADLVASWHVGDVGIVRAGDDWEYPLWARLRAKGSRTVLWDVTVDPVQRGVRPHTPTAIVCLHDCVVPTGWRQLRTGPDVVVAWRPRP